MKRNIKKPGNQKIMLGKRIIEFLDDEFIVETPISKTSYQWSVITKLGQSKNTYFLYLGSSQAIIIPKRILTEEGKTELEDFVNARMKSA